MSQPGKSREVAALPPPNALHALLDQFFPAEEVWDSDPVREVKNATVEVNKGNVILFCWLVLTFPAMWVRGDTGGTLLSIAAALVGVAFAQTQKLLASEDKIGLFVCCLFLPFIGGLVFGNTASADGTSTENAIAVSVLSGVLLLFIGLKVYDSRYNREGQDTRTAQEPKLTVEQKAEKEANDRRLQERHSQIMVGISAIGCGASLILAIVGTVLTDGDVNIRLALLGISVACALLAAQFCIILDEKANGGPIVEFLIVFLSLTVDVLPLAIELTLEEGVDNPGVMNIAAWVGFGSASFFWCLTVYSIIDASQKRLELEAATEDLSQKPDGMSKQTYLDLVAFKREMQSASKAKVEAFSKELEQEEEALMEKLDFIHAKKNVINEKEGKDLEGERNSSVGKLRLPSEENMPPVEANKWHEAVVEAQLGFVQPQSSVTDSQLVFVQQGYYTEPGQDGRPGPPMYVKEGYYPARGTAGTARQSVAPTQDSRAPSVTFSLQGENNSAMRPGILKNTPGTPMPGQVGTPQPPGMAGSMPRQPGAPQPPGIGRGGGGGGMMAGAPMPSPMPGQTRTPGPAGMVGFMPGQPGTPQPLGLGPGMGPRVGWTVARAAMPPGR